MRTKKQSRPQAVIVLDFEGYAVSFKNIIKLIEFFPYGSSRRIAIELLALTGMRPSELEQLSPHSFWKDMIVWRPGKNQPGYRKVQLPAWFLKELDHYLQNNHFGNNKLFPWKDESLRQYINKWVRHKLGGDFMKKRRVRQRGRVIDEFIIQLKSFRHTYACKEFHDAMAKYGTELSIHMVASNMKHSSTYMTARHYCSDIQYLKNDLQRYQGTSMADIIKDSRQQKLALWFNQRGK